MSGMSWITYLLFSPSDLEFGVLGPPIFSKRFTVLAKICGNFDFGGLRAVVMETVVVGRGLTRLGIFSWLEPTALLLFECKHRFGCQGTRE